MTRANTGSKVKVRYACKLDDGTVVAQSREEEPLEFTVGQGRILPGIQEAVQGMEAGESKTIRIPPDKAFGPHRKELMAEVGRDRFPGDLTPEVGQHLTVEQANGQSTTVTVADVSESTVTLDANHPLASTDLNFDLEVLEVS